MELVLSLIHVLACLLIIGVILIQSGKGGGLGAGFGGASSAAQQIFGGRGAGNFLTRSTVALAVTFMVTSLWLAYISSRPRSLLDLSEVSGAVSSDEDTIVEKGSGELVVIGEEGSGTVPEGGLVDEPPQPQGSPLQLEIPPAPQVEEPTEPGAEPEPGDEAADTAPADEPAPASTEAPTDEPAPKVEPEKPAPKP